MTEEHHHEWVRDPEHDGVRAWACTDCTETCATCGTCGRASGSSLLLCDRCERHAGRVLDDIDHALGLWQADPRSPMRSPGDMRLVPGGGEAAGITRPSDVTDRMLSWVARWTEHTGATNARPAAFLKSRHIWAAHNPELSDWPDYLRAMRALRADARRIAGLLPQRLAEPCPLCGGTVVQDWSDEDWEPLEDGLSDIVRCTGCGTTWGDRTRWRFTMRHHIVMLPAAHPDALVTLDQARMIWPDIPAATWRSWAKRWRDEGDDLLDRAWHWWGLYRAFVAGPDAWPSWAPDDWKGPGEPPSLAGWMPQMGERDGVPTYRVGDLHALALRRDAEVRAGRRPGRRATA